MSMVTFSTGETNVVLTIVTSPTQRSKQTFHSKYNVTSSSAAYQCSAAALYDHPLYEVQEDLEALQNNAVFNVVKHCTQRPRTPSGEP
ncbi:unnamed protein product [Arctogadus glacialis]